MPGRRSDGVTTCPNPFQRQFRVVDGLKAFAGRARRELLATGETVRRRAVETAGELTPRLAQIARLTWDGRASPEISTRLFIGPCPAGWHPGTVQSSNPPGPRSSGHAHPGTPDPVPPTQEGRNRSNGCEPTWGPSSTDALLLTRRSSWHPSWPPTLSPTAVHASRAAGSSSAPRYAPATTYGSKSRTRATPGPAITPEMAGPTDSPSARPSPGPATAASAAMPPSAVSHGPGLTGPAAERDYPPCRACLEPGRAGR